MAVNGITMRCCKACPKLNAAKVRRGENDELRVRSLKEEVRDSGGKSADDWRREAKHGKGDCMHP